MAPARTERVWPHEQESSDSGRTIIRRIALAAAFAFACTSAAAQTLTYLDASLREEGRPSSQAVLVLGPAVEVREISAGGVIETVPAWSEQAERHVSAALARVMRERPGTTIVRLPDPSGEHARLIEEHLALFEAVADSARDIAEGRDGPWKTRVAAGDVDLGIGTGLAFLAAETGASAALIVNVRDYVASTPRKVLMAAGVFFGLSIPLGRTYATAGLIDLHTGRLLWYGYETSATQDLRLPSGAATVVEELMRSFPPRVAAATVTAGLPSP